MIPQVKSPPAARETWLPQLVRDINRALREAWENGGGGGGSVDAFTIDGGNASTDYDGLLVVDFGSAA